MSSKGPSPLRVGVGLRVFLERGLKGATRRVAIRVRM